MMLDKNCEEEGMGGDGQMIQSFSYTKQILKIHCTAWYLQLTILYYVLK